MTSSPACSRLPPSSSSPAFSRLPSEVLLHIEALLQTSDELFTFSLISRQCASVVPDLALWRDLNLATKSKEKHDLRRKVKALMMAGTAKRWGAVRSIMAAAGVESVHSLLQVLEYTCETLLSLDIAQVTDQHASTCGVDDLDIRLFHSGLELSFPALTTVRLDNVTRLIGVIPYLCALAPNLDSLDIVIDAQHYRAENPEAPFHTDFPHQLAGNTKLRRIRLSYTGYQSYIYRDPHGHYQYYGCEPIVSETLGDLLDNIPLLRHLSVAYGLVDDYIDEEEEQGGEGDRFLDSLCQLAGLTDLYWRTGWRDMPGWVAEAGETKAVLSGLRRLVIDFDKSEKDYKLPTYPALETVIFDCSKTLESKPPFGLFPPSLSLILLNHKLVSWLRANPHLGTIHFARNLANLDTVSIFDNFDRLAKRADATCTIRSLIYGPLEILHVRLLLEDAEPSPGADGEGFGGGWNSSWGRVIHIAGGGDGNDESTASWAEPVTQDLMDWEGCSIDLAVLLEMVEVEGVSDEDWVERGLVIGDDAWKVMTDWRDMTACEFEPLALIAFGKTLGPH